MFFSALTDKINMPDFNYFMLHPLQSIYAVSGII